MMQKHRQSDETDIGAKGIGLGLFLGVLLWLLIIGLIFLLKS